MNCISRNQPLHQHEIVVGATRSRRVLRNVHAAAIASALLLLSSLTGCTPSDEYGDVEPRELTTKEAERLSLVRMNNYDQQSSGFTMSMNSDGKKMWLEGRVDFREHLGYANVLVDSPTESFALLQWDLKVVAAVSTQSQELPEQPPVQAPWQPRQLKPNSSALDTGLSLVLNLAADRPENPVLLQQNGARWYGKAEVSGKEVDVFSGPGEDNTVSDSLLYFIDDESKLHKMIADLPSTEGDAVITLTDTDIDTIDTALAG